MKKKVALSATAIAVLASAVPAQVAPVEATGNVIYVDSTKASSNGDFSGTGTQDYPYRQLSTAVEKAQSGDTIIVIGEGYVNDLWDGTPWYIDKDITIRGEGSIPPTISVRTPGIILGANVTFENVALGLANKTHDAIFANGHELNLINVSRAQGTRQVDLFAGGLYGATDYVAGTNPVINVITNSQFVGTINGQFVYSEFGGIYAGSMNTTYDQSAKIKISNTGSTGVLKVAGIYASGAWEADPGTMLDMTEPALPEADPNRLYNFGDVEFTLENVNQTVNGNTGTTSTTSLKSIGKNRTTINATGITNLELEGTTFTVSQNIFTNGLEKLTLSNNAVLDLTNYDTGNFNVSTYKGVGAIALPKEGITINVENDFTPSDAVTFYLAGYNPYGYNGNATKNHVYFTTPTDSATFNYEPSFNDSQLGLELRPIQKDSRVEWTVVDPKNLPVTPDQTDPPKEEEGEEELPKLPTITGFNIDEQYKNITKNVSEFSGPQLISIPFSVTAKEDLSKYFSLFLEEYDDLAVTVDGHEVVYTVDESDVSCYYVKDLNMYIYLQPTNEDDLSKQEISIEFKDGGTYVAPEVGTYNIGLALSGQTLNTTLVIEGSEEEPGKDPDGDGEQQPTPPTLTGIELRTSPYLEEAYSAFEGGKTPDVLFTISMQATGEVPEGATLDFFEPTIKVGEHTATLVKKDTDNYYRVDALNLNIRFNPIAGAIGQDMLITFTDAQGNPTAPTQESYEFTISKDDIEPVSMELGIIDFPTPEEPGGDDNGDGDQQPALPNITDITFDNDTGSVYTDATTFNAEYNFTATADSNEVVDLAQYPLTFTFGGVQASPVEGTTNEYQVADKNIVITVFSDRITLSGTDSNLDPGEHVITMVDEKHGINETFKLVAEEPQVRILGFMQPDGDTLEEVNTEELAIPFTVGFSSSQSNPVPFNRLGYSKVLLGDKQYLYDSPSGLYVLSNSDIALEIKALDTVGEYTAILRNKDDKTQPVPEGEYSFTLESSGTSATFKYIVSEPEEEPLPEPDVPEGGDPDEPTPPTLTDITFEPNTKTVLWGNSIEETFNYTLSTEDGQIVTDLTKYPITIFYDGMPLIQTGEGTGIYKPDGSSNVIVTVADGTITVTDHGEQVRPGNHTIDVKLTDYNISKRFTLEVKNPVKTVVFDEPKKQTMTLEEFNGESTSIEFGVTLDLAEEPAKLINLQRLGYNVKVGDTLLNPLRTQSGDGYYRNNENTLQVVFEPVEDDLTKQKMIIKFEDSFGDPSEVTPGIYEFTLLDGDVEIDTATLTIKEEPTITNLTAETTEKTFNADLFETHENPQTFFEFNADVTGDSKELSEYEGFTLSINGKEAGKQTEGDENKLYYYNHQEMVKARIDYDASTGKYKLVLLSHDGTGAPTQPQKNEYTIKLSNGQGEELTFTANVKKEEIPPALTGFDRGSDEENKVFYLDAYDEDPDATPTFEFSVQAEGGKEGIDLNEYEPTVTINSKVATYDPNSKSYNLTDLGVAVKLDKLDESNKHRLTVKGIDSNGVTTQLKEDTYQISLHFDKGNLTIPFNLDVRSNNNGPGYLEPTIPTPTGIVSANTDTNLTVSKDQTTQGIEYPLEVQFGSLGAPDVSFNDLGFNVSFGTELGVYRKATGDYYFSTSGVSVKFNKTAPGKYTAVFKKLDDNGATVPFELGTTRVIINKGQVGIGFDLTVEEPAPTPPTEEPDPVDPTPPTEPDPEEEEELTYILGEESRTENITTNDVNDKNCLVSYFYPEFKNVGDDFDPAEFAKNLKVTIDGVEATAGEGTSIYRAGEGQIPVSIEPFGDIFKVVFGAGEVNIPAEVRSYVVTIKHGENNPTATVTLNVRLGYTEEGEPGTPAPKPDPVDPPTPPSGGGTTTEPTNPPSGGSNTGGGTTNPPSQGGSSSGGNTGGSPSGGSGNTGGSSSGGSNTGTVTPTTPPSTGGGTTLPAPDPKPEKPAEKPPTVQDRPSGGTPSRPTTKPTYRPPVKPDGVASPVEDLEDLDTTIQEKVDSLMSEIVEQDKGLILDLTGDADDLSSVSTLEVTKDGIFANVDGQKVKFGSDLKLEDIDMSKLRIIRTDGSPVLYTTDGESFILTTHNFSDILITERVVEPFVDVSKDDWFQPYVDELYNRGITTGTTATTFSPNGTITRAQVAALLARAYELESTGNKPALKDVADQWYADDVQALVDNGIIKGYEDGTFRGDQPVTREQLAVMLQRLANQQGKDTSVSNVPTFTDTDKMTDYGKSAIEWAASEGIINSGNGVAFKPKSTATRAQVAKMLTLFMNK